MDSAGFSQFTMSGRRQRYNCVTVANLLACTIGYTTKLKASSAHEYKPSEAQALIPELEICWGSIAIRQSDGDHPYERCDVPHVKRPFPWKGGWNLHAARSKRQSFKYIFVISMPIRLYRTGMGPTKHQIAS